MYTDLTTTRTQEKIHPVFTEQISSASSLVLLTNSYVVPFSYFSPLFSIVEFL